MSACAVTVEAFLRGEVAPEDFPHREHLRLAFEMLRRGDFATTALQYSQGLRALTARAGRPEAFNLTVTIALLALIAERLAAFGGGTFAEFTAAHPELSDRRLLERWYRPAQLSSDHARRAFVLPDPALAPGRPQR